jgi:hypothetical protein
MPLMEAVGAGVGSAGARHKCDLSAGHPGRADSAQKVPRRSFHLPGVCTVAPSVAPSVPHG